VPSLWSRLYGQLYAATATVLASFGRREMYLAYSVRKARRYSVPAFPDGMYGRIVGEALPHGEPLRAPISGMECVFYILRVVDPWAADSSGAPVVVAREVSAAPFFVDDGAGRALIDPAGAMGFLGAPSAAGPCDPAPPPAIMWLLQEHGRTARTHYFYAEFIVPPKQIISVMGGGTREPDPLAPPAPQYRGDPPMRLRLAQTPPYSLMISDSADTFR
jgi:hypothetical protein